MIEAQNDINVMPLNGFHQHGLFLLIPVNIVLVVTFWELAALVYHIFLLYHAHLSLFFSSMGLKGGCLLISWIQYEPFLQQLVVLCWNWPQTTVGIIFTFASCSMWSCLLVCLFCGLTSASQQYFMYVGTEPPLPRF